MISKHVVITGTGRAGTSFLIQLLTHLGLNTGFDVNNIDLIPMARAGLEWNLLDVDAPYIVKSPVLCDQVEAVLASSVQIENVIVPVRRFDAAAASRVYVQKLRTGDSDRIRQVAGGLWGTDKADDQADVLRFKFTKLIESLVHHDIPMTFMMYPRLVRDHDYVYEKLSFLLRDIDLPTFRAVFHRVVRPEWIHQFTADDI